MREAVGKPRTRADSDERADVEPDDGMERCGSGRKREAAEFGTLAHEERKERAEAVRAEDEHAERERQENRGWLRHHRKRGLLEARALQLPGPVVLEKRRRVAEEKHKREGPRDADRAEDPESVAPSVGRHRAEHARERARHDDAYVESALVDGKRRRARLVVVLRDEGARGRRDHALADSVHEPVHDEHADESVYKAGAENARREEERADDYDPLAPKHVRGDSRKRNGETVREQEGGPGEAPLRVARPGERKLDVGKRRVEYLPRRVHQEVGERQQRQHHPLVPHVVFRLHNGAIIPKRP